MHKPLITDLKKLLFLIFVFSQFTFAQEIIFPGYYGAELKNKLVETYKPQVVLSYNDARDKMYGLIDNKNDSLICVYSGYRIFVPYNDPSPRNFTNAANPIINCEHTWPKSKGALENTQSFSNMHHLFPTNAVPNAGRGNLPFSEIDDNQTDKWYLNATISSTIPSANIDSYSELDENKSFEPPEDHKGNVARAMFYFYTMYQQQADNEDPNFFSIQKDVFRQWNMLDPVDEAEILRTNQIAVYQDNKANPFIIDTTLIGRVYFGVTTSLNDEQNNLYSFTLNQNYPNPFNGQTVISFNLDQPEMVKLAVFNAVGQAVDRMVNQTLPAGKHEYRFNSDAFSSGVYYYRLETPIGHTTKKMLLVR